MSEFLVLVEEYGTGHAVAAVKQGILIDFLIDASDPEECSLVGSIMAGKLNQPQKGINGTFVTLPGNKMGFLRGKQNATEHSIVLVYSGISAEAHKAQPLSTKLLFKGRYIILTPERPGINISRKIKSADKRKALCEGLVKFEDSLPDGCGIIIRSEASTADLKDIIQEIEEKLLQYALVLKDDLSKPRVIIEPIKARERAILDWNYAEPALFIEEDSCFDAFGVWEQVSDFLKTRVVLENGGFLMIEPTSALVAVDVNTGSDLSYAGALKTNLLAMKDLPRQLEIRGLGGKIVVEFAPLSKKDRLKVETELKTALQSYKSKYVLVGWTKLGNLELQKNRQKQSISDILRNDNRFSVA